MEHDQRESLSHNEIHVSDVFQDNDNFVSSFIPSHEVDHFSDRENVLDEEGYNDFPIEGNEVQAVSATREVSKTQQIVLSPGGSKLWIPIMDAVSSITIGEEFDSIHSAEERYRKYADIAGFDVRLSNKKTNKLGRVQVRYFVCSKEGQPAKRDFDSIEAGYGEKKRRNSFVKRTGCNACMKIHFVSAVGRYVVYKINECHNHKLFLPEDRLFSRSNRQLGFTDRTNVFNACSSKVGITQSHRMQSIIKGGIESSGGTARDHINFKRDVINFVGNKDAQMFVNKLSNRRANCPNYFFEYKVEKKELIACFWADETARKNYKEFGDVISFDATYRTNQYQMRFVPFVAVDNHTKSVVVGAALIAQEKVPHFTWILQAFMKAHGTQPKLCITDQCPSMKQAIPIVFPNAKHRLCMWHITNKFKDNISSYVAKETSFLTEIKKLVWNIHNEPEEFESRWNELMDMYSLRGVPWWDEMYNIRDSWIPAYYKDFHMSGLMKTTSRSESINAFFRVYAKFADDLVFFINQFDHAIEDQRKAHCALEVETRTTIPLKLSPSSIEAQACDVYTRTIFVAVQKELNKAVWFCTLKCDEDGDDVKVYQVVHNILDESFDCDCNHFQRIGFLCRHVFKVMLNDQVQKIPEKYILHRWRRGLVPVEIMPARARYGEMNVVKQEKMNKAVEFFDKIIGSVRNDDDELTNFVDYLNNYAEAVAMGKPLLSNKESKDETIAELIGVSQPESVDIFPPSGIRNKGRGKSKRMIGASERAAQIAKKPKRLCRSCGIESRHDSRNCPEKRVG
ncbi:hypothetical protein OSB04_un000894 [Centaurea solstitialis]|uniref:SWIM-type domain-containing protein n=1 Tax=Centaurea solstitialis TaxID=347529 RepID=A0AA38W269_9ASTR|nr:hypothetical protein OSB04_un000894 [Centaurea solstitialis]